MSVTGERTISLGGKDFTLRPSFKALCKIESRTGQRLVPLMTRIGGQDVGIQDVAIILQSFIEAGGAQPVPSLDQVGEWLVAEGMLSHLKVCMDVLAQAVKVPGGNAEGVQE